MLKKSGAQPVPGIDEVNFFKDDNSIVHFERPEGIKSKISLRSDSEQCFWNLWQAPNQKYFYK